MKKIKDDDGAIMLEFAMVMSLVLIVLAFMLGFGFFICQKTMCYTIATETASYIGDSYKYTGLNKIDETEVPKDKMKNLKNYRTSFALISMRNSSKNKTDAYSDIKNAEVKFVIDRTEPVITVSGIEKSGRYQTNSQKVTVIPNDDGGKLDKLIIEVKDTDGKLLSTPYELEGDALTQQLEENNNKLVFDLGEGIYQNVDIVCIDKAGNKYVSKAMYHDVTVSSNAMVIFWANRMLRWGVILGLIILTGGIIIILVRWKKKKDDLNRK